MLLSQTMQGQNYRVSRGAPTVAVSGLAHDSRLVAPGEAFFCLPGQARDGHDFVAEVIARGAAAIIAERPLALPEGVTCLLVANARRSLALAAAAFWGHPSSKLRVFAVTGTNGKTTVNHLIQTLLDAGGGTSGLLGTVENRVGRCSTPATLTTPDALEVQRNLAAMVAAGASRACLEASSHGLKGHRLDGCEVDVAILTNVTRDHMEFHRDVSAYAATKLSLFRGLGATRTKGGPRNATKGGQVYAVLNRDDEFFGLFRKKTTVPILTYGARCSSHVKMLGAALGATGSLVRVAFDRRPRGLPGAEWLRPHPGWPDEGVLPFPQPGRHNVRNLLAALAVAWAEGCPWPLVQRAAESFAGVPGRWEVVAGSNGVTGVVDFAHNPEGLRQALETARLVARERVILVFGCEGEKDRGKRPVMGAIAARLADHVILTIDNTFGESETRILSDIAGGLAGAGAGAGELSGGRAAFEVVRDRRKAIFRAASLARAGDLVMVAGRGHDARLVLGSTVHLLDDRQVLTEALGGASHHQGPSRVPAYSHSMVAGGLEVTS